MSTVDIGELRRELERYVALAAQPGTSPSLLHDADRLLAFMPLLLDELEQLRAIVGKAELAGWRKAVAALRDGERFYPWLRDFEPPSIGQRELYAAYLEALVNRD